MKTLKPFFSYFGGKWRAAPHYPEPKYDRIIEPFAGAAGYSVRHYNHKVTLYEVDPLIYGLWEYLTSVRSKEIRGLPLKVKHVDDLKCCQEAKWLIGFWLGGGLSRPGKTPSAWMRGGTKPNSFWGEAIRDRIAQQVRHVRHWEVKNESYEEAHGKATWFIDPPYQEAGSAYRFKFDKYKHLGRWSKQRRGQVIVCEAEGADWMRFKPFRTISATKGIGRKGFSKEVIWLKG